MQCVLCNEEIEPQANGWAGGHNAQPLAEGRCCDKCNFDVIQHRFRCDHLVKKLKDPNYRTPPKLPRGYPFYADE